MNCYFFIYIYKNKNKKTVALFVALISQRTTCSLDSMECT